LPSEQLIGLSPAGMPLLVRYDLESVRGSFTPAAVATRRADLWRYAEVLPVRDGSAKLTLGEGWTPLIDAHRTAERAGVRRLWLKDEGQNPTGSFKARGQYFPAVALSPSFLNIANKAEGVVTVVLTLKLMGAGILFFVQSDFACALP